LILSKGSAQSLDLLSTQASLNQETSESSEVAKQSNPQTCNISALGNHCDRPRQTLAEHASTSALHDAAARNDHDELLSLIKEGTPKS
jgi:hypothetical protein